MIISIRSVCRAYEFCGIIFGVSEVAQCCSGQVGSGAIPAEYHSFILSTAGEKM